MERSTPPLPRLTEAQYLEMEESAARRHEFRNGHAIGLAGGTEQHAAIAANLISELHSGSKGKACRAYGSDLRLRISELGDYVYPDVMVICGPPVFHRPPSRSVVLNPCLVIEVTSPSTEGDDRGQKFADYRTLDSLQEYLLISQHRLEVETYYRQMDGIWAIGPRYNSLDQMVKLRSLEIDIAMAEIYAGIDFPPPTASGSTDTSDPDTIS